jgi:hypothetical protein
MVSNASFLRTDLAGQCEHVYNLWTRSITDLIQGRKFDPSRIRTHIKRKLAHDESDPDYISMKLIFLINKLLTIEALEGFTGLTQKYRKIRRGCMGVERYREYREQIGLENSEIEGLLFGELGDLLAGFKISFATYVDSV